MGKPVTPEAQARAREYQRQLMNRRRATARDIDIPPVADPARRKRCTAKLREFAATYFPLTCYLDPGTHHLRILDELQRAIEHGEKLAIAAPRGHGKSSLSLIAIVWALVTGRCRYIVIVTSEGSLGRARLRDIRGHFETNDLLAADYPEVCAPIRALQGESKRATGQTVGGQRTRIIWSTDEIRLPEIEGSPSSGSMVRAKSLEGAIRGLVDGSVRPDCILLDDPQTRESATSTGQIETRHALIRRDIEGLRGPGIKLSIISLWTRIRHGDLACRYTDGATEPDYRPLVFPALDPTPPQPLIDLYCSTYRECQRNGDRKARGAHALYLSKRQEFEGNARAAWAADFVPDVLPAEYLAAPLPPELEEWRKHPDFPRVEVSAVQHQLNCIAERGLDVWLCEYQNDPPPPETTAATSINADAVLLATHSLPRNVVPEDTAYLVEGRDVGRYALHYVVCAVLPGRSLWIVDYGTHPVDSPSGKIDAATADGRRAQQQVNAAINAALVRRRETVSEQPYRTADGREIPITLALTDSRYGMDAVIDACQKSGGSDRPCMGMGTARGQKRFTIPRHIPQKNITPDHYLYYQKDPKRGIRYHVSSDLCKRDIHSGFLLDIDSPGSVRLPKPSTPDEHVTIANHVTAENEILVGGYPTWQKKPGREANHWLDCCAYCRAALSVLEAADPTLLVDSIARIAATHPAPTPSKAPTANICTSPQTKQKPQRPAQRKNRSRFRLT